ncbi:RlmE family RNA methyltransferase [Phycisphaeraceae bacterium AH-315-B13]|nr:RlmE family RNA methyltransferase [Phycisphaeraceae bacterium AH-315-B13]PHQ79305.1 MAG: 50S rRNA methyltransferase [Phycisphaera sp.]
MARRVTQDTYFKRAKEDGYLARSAYKLKQLHDRFDLVPKGGRVLDLGCAPGSWMQVGAELIGKSGIIVGVDLRPVDLKLDCEFHTIEADINDLDPEQLKELVGGPFDAVLSDVAPNTTGHGDDLRSAHLCRAVLKVAEHTLRPGGRLGMKIFDGAEFQDVLNETRILFQQVKSYKPDATRNMSRETYIVARNFRGARLTP